MSMSGTLARGKKFVTTAGALAAAAALGSTLLGAAPAQAAAAQPYGKVLSATGMKERRYPSTDAPATGYQRHHAQVGLRCKVRAQNVGGNDVWYQLRDRATWVAAKYVANTGPVPFCKDVQRFRTADGAAHQNARG
ncbi:SH3 domain-containing protein [Streptomyces sp. NPDC059080]|uniref:SH3 domain-containing protein n=1 Tax=Streptomyces sp. NPDC059080 TaxID=3346718 RepID=UPI00368A0FC4